MVQQVYFKREVSMKNLTLSLLAFVIFFNVEVFAFKKAKNTTRYASLRSNEVNLRVGPSINHDTIWVFVRARLPVEIISEFGTWRRICDSQGTEGWIHQSMLSSLRTVVIIGSGFVPLMYKADEKSKIVARMEPGVIGNLRRNIDGWCYINIKGTKGWVNKANVWGVK